MSDAIKNDQYFQEGFRELEETLAETTGLLAKSLPLDDELRALIPWQDGKGIPDTSPRRSRARRRPTPLDLL